MGGHDGSWGGGGGLNKPILGITYIRVLEYSEHNGDPSFG